MKEHSPKNFKLLDLLSRFIDNLKMTPEVLKRCNDFLFGSNELDFSSADQELSETVMYLKDIMEINNLYTLDHLFVHFNKKRQKVANYITKKVSPGAAREMDIIAEFLPMDTTWEMIHIETGDKPLAEQFPLVNDKPISILLPCPYSAVMFCNTDYHANTLIVLDKGYTIRADNQAPSMPVTQKCSENKIVKTTERNNRRNQNSKKSVREQS